MERWWPTFFCKTQDIVKPGIDGTQDFRVRVNVLAKCGERDAVTPIPPCLHPFDFISVFQQNVVHP